MRHYGVVFPVLGLLSLVPAVAKGAAFGIPNTDCLVTECHGSGSPYPRFIIAGRVDFDAAYAQNDGVLSQHNVPYSQDGNFETIETPNGCKACHVADPTRPEAHRYVATATILRYPDAYALHAAGDAIAPATDFSLYQDFCLSCHDGADASNPTFEGPLPSQQVAPSDPANSALVQTAAPWVVPAVPPKDANATAPFTTPTPYFAYYKTNGHGRDLSIKGNQMKVTCLAGGDGSGCHNAHGSTNRYLLDDSFGTGVDLATEVATVVCFDCHTAGVDFAMTNAGAVGASTFHGWDGVTGNILHDRNRYRNGTELLGDPIDGMSQWFVFSQDTSLHGPDLNIISSPALLGVLPFYAASTTGTAHGRSYPVTLTNANWVHCLTCHDPHGTGTGTQPAMLRIAYDQADFTETDPLCGQCHKK